MRRNKRLPKKRTQYSSKIKRRASTINEIEPTALDESVTRCNNPTMIIDQIDNRYRCIFMYRSQTVSFNIDWSPKDLHDRYEHLSNQLYNICKRPIKNESKVLSAIAQITYGHFSSILPPEIQTTILELLSVENPTYIEIVSDSFIYPWSFLYTKPPTENVSLSNFFGSKIVTGRTFKKSAPPKSFPRPEINLSKDQLHLVFGWYNRLKHCNEIEVPYFNKLKIQHPQIYIDEIPEIVANQPHLDRAKEFQRKLQNKSPIIIHLACRAENGTLEKDRAIYLRNECKISQQDLMNIDFTLPQAPVVFLNACELGVAGGLHISTFIRFLFSAGGRTVVAPDSLIGDWSASHFSTRFYEKFLIDRSDIVNALHSTRLDLWRTDKDLSGFLYALYGQPDACLLST